ncbi:ATP/GTP-binding protein [Streptomyces spiroverticillatus]|uniref:ATP/GTP-binding protein n=1 Tax=Streptomyces finlayi TaxID=67296 RepID=A0A919CD76_9ACTN|nr:FG-GAP-like repeat-containing protein [Streptomyces finlayi]GHA27859.1 ATP/GTP-binding protein [Streptomyces spiroverticillatus]GHD08850.1 ATP/GTP-binding protein [Streptomyces finlayi]
MRSTSARLARSTAVAVAASLAALTLSAPSASAATGERRCPAGKFCLFQYQDFKGEMKIVTSSMPTMGKWDNSTSSLVNNSAYWVQVNTNPETALPGERWIIAPHHGADNFGGPKFRKLWDNTISSLRMATTEYETVHRVPWMDWSRSASDDRPQGLPAVAQFGDLNNDRRPDLLERADDGRLWFLSGITGADGGTRGRLVGGGWNSMTQLSRHGDHNSDGKEDLYARDTAGTLWFYPGRGDGAFGNRTKVGGGWNSMREISAAGDLTGDGRRDLLARDTAGTLWAYPGNGKGTFAARTKVGGGWNTMNRLVSPGDLTGDGKADLLARDGSETLWLYPGNGRGAFAARKKMPGKWPADEHVIAAGDINGDGRSDLLHTVFSSLYVQHGNGSGGLGGAQYDTLWDEGDRVRAF